MKRLPKERDRLLRRSARAIGLGSSVVAIACLLVPGAVDGQAFVLSLPLLLLIALAQFRFGRTGASIWLAIIVIAGLAVMLIVGLSPEPLNPTSVALLSTLCGGVIPSVAAFTPNKPTALALASVGFVVTFTAAAILTLNTGAGPAPLALTVVGWSTTALSGVWVGRSVPLAMERLRRIGHVHESERRASERDATRRQDARLLHDTVLATLTLLAHSGIGVNADALRQQASDDAKLLRQLRLGGSPAPRSSGIYALEPAAVSQLGSTLESVKQRFQNLGLEVHWHGSGQILLPSDVLDSFLRALGECLENVRRHANVTEADVTVTDDDIMVRAMVTDSGVGFDIEDVGLAKLGFAESVVARLAEVGGSARLFSSPGAGTTVVLEVPK